MNCAQALAIAAATFAFTEGSWSARYVQAGAELTALAGYGQTMAFEAVRAATEKPQGTLQQCGKRGWGVV